MKWFIPAWNGDFRLEPKGETTDLIIQDPTAQEAEMLNKFLKACRKGGRRWIPAGGKIQQDQGPYRTNASRTITLNVSMDKAAPVLVELAKPKDRTITALKFSNGEMEIAETVDTDALAELAENAMKPEAEAAASVSRPTPCCPQCEPGSVGPATEVLLSFLDDKEHNNWAKHRALLVEGGLTGNRYILAHRHSPLAQKFGRICYDLDARKVVHFFDWSVPPEEEVLGAKLILEHREPWLRNEATLIPRDAPGGRFKNPFGGLMDGTETSAFTHGFGSALLKALK